MKNRPSKDPRGYPSLVFGRMCCADFESRPIKVPSKYQVFKKYWPINVPICLILGKILSKITQFFQNFLKAKPILAQVWGTFEKSTRLYTKFDFLKAVIHITKRLILLPMLVAHTQIIFWRGVGPEFWNPYSFFSLKNGWFLRFFPKFLQIGTHF